MNKKITLFAGALTSFELISYLVNNKLLSVIVVADKKDIDTYNFLNVLKQYKIPHFIYNDKDSLNIEALNKIETNLALVFGFAFKISQHIIDIFQDNIYNIHASLLPKYRGKNPIFWQIHNGEEQSALCIHKLTQTFDNGDIVLKKRFMIDRQDTFGVLNGVISQLAVELVKEFLQLLRDDKITASAQIGDITYANEVKQDDILIDWQNMTSFEIYNLIRACNPIFGGAKSKWRNSMISFLEASVVDMDNLKLEAGIILHIGFPEGFIVSTIDGSLRIDTVSVPDGFFSGLRFAKRFKIDVGEKLTTIKL